MREKKIAPLLVIAVSLAGLSLIVILGLFGIPQRDRKADIDGFLAVYHHPSKQPLIETIYVPASPLPDHSILRFHAINDDNIGSLEVNPLTRWNHPVVIINGQNTNKAIAQLSGPPDDRPILADKKVWNGYLWRAETATAGSIPWIYFTNMYFSYDPTFEKPDYIEIFYKDDKNRPVYWSSKWIVEGQHPVSLKLNP